MINFEGDNIHTSQAIEADDETQTEIKTMSQATIYASLFCGVSKPLSKDQQVAFDEVTADAKAKVDAMTDEQKEEAFRKLMQR
jgi:hypothetical protein